MGRKSLATVRRGEILDAFEVCISQDGLQASSLGRIATAAGVKTSVIGHYFGNRAGLVEALCDRLVERYVQLFETVSANTRAQDPVEAGIRFLFSDRFRDLDLFLVSRELVAASLHDDVIREGLRRSHEIFEASIGEILVRRFPDAPVQARADVAFALMGLAEASVQFASYGNGEARARGRRAARMLLSTLES